MQGLKVAAVTIALVVTVNLFSTAAAEPPAKAGDMGWTQYRGPGRNGASTESVTWPAAGPKKVWGITLAKGYGSLTVENGRVYLMGTPGKGNDFSTTGTYCLDAATGKVVWEHKAGKAVETTGATPTLAGDRVISAGGGGELLCLDSGTGTLVWEVRMGLKPDPYCYGSSPLVHKGRVIVLAGPAVRAFDLADGKEIWKTDWRIPGGGGRWSSPVLATFDGRETVVCVSRANLVGLDPADGRLLWKLDLETNPAGEDLVNTPAVSGNLIVCLAFRGQGARRTRLLCVEIRNGKPEERWRSQIRSGSRAQSPTIWDGCVYLSSDTQPIKTPQDVKGCLNCFDLQTGKLLWTSNAPQSRGATPARGMQIYNDGGAFMIAGGKLLLLDGMGHIELAEVSAQGCTVLGDADFTPETKAPDTAKNLGPLQSRFQFLTPPLVVNGRLYVRNHEDLVCYDLRE